MSKSMLSKCLWMFDVELDVTGDGCPIVNVEEGGGVVLGAAPRELLERSRFSASTPRSAKRCLALATSNAARAASSSASSAEDDP